jgi:hypothetical protein
MHEYIPELTPGLAVPEIPQTKNDVSIEIIHGTLEKIENGEMDSVIEDKNKNPTLH